MLLSLIVPSPSLESEMSELVASQPGLGGTPSGVTWALPLPARLDGPSAMAVETHVTHMMNMSAHHGTYRALDQLAHGDGPFHAHEQNE
jgi:hypothetical protein